MGKLPHAISGWPTVKVGTVTMVPELKRHDEFKPKIVVFTIIVLLSLCLDSTVWSAAIDGNPLNETSDAALDLTGEWGGDGISLVISEDSVHMEFDCAFGEIGEPVHVDSKGNFEKRGVYMIERGGPGRPGTPPLKRRSAVYRGWTDGKEMRLTVLLVDGREVGSFSLEKGHRALLDKCL